MSILSNVFRHTAPSIYVEHKPKHRGLGKDYRAVLVFLAPSLLGFILFFLGPFIAGLYYSFVDSPINGSFVGLANYKSLLENTYFREAGINTLIITGISVPLIMSISLGLALLLNKALYFRELLRTAFVIPLVVPVASVVLVWQVIFDMHGSLNSVITAFGATPVDWMKTDWARLVIVIVYLWKNTGYNVVLFIAGLSNIPVEYYESSEIDGASAFAKFKHITFIYLTPTTFFIFIISIINSFKVFRETYLISGPYPHDSIYMLQHYMNNMFSSLDYQKLTSAAFIMALAIYLLVVVFFNIERRISRAIR